VALVGAVVQKGCVGQVAQITQILQIVQIVQILQIVQVEYEAQMARLNTTRRNPDG
jgi:hypothetical protein